MRVLVDAEQTYFQRLFDHLTLHYLMTRYNREQVTIYNTVQAYLKVSVLPWLQWVKPHLLLFIVTA